MKTSFERIGRGQEPSRGHKFSILENVLSIRAFTSQTLASFPSDLVGVALVGATPSICCRRPRCRLKAPLGLSLLRCAAQTRFHPKPCLERTRRNCVKLTQFLLSPCGSIGEITLGIFQRLFQKFLQLIRIIIHPMVGLRKFNIVVWNVVQNVRSH